MVDKKIVRVNVEVIYDDGTLEELKVAEPDRSAPTSKVYPVGIYRELFVGYESMLCEPR